MTGGGGQGGIARGRGLGDFGGFGGGFMINIPTGFRDHNTPCVVLRVESGQGSKIGILGTPLFLFFLSYLV